MNTYINEISMMMEDAELDSIDLIWERKHQSIQKCGIRYEILAIYKPDDGDTELMLATIPSYEFKLVHLYVGNSWPEQTWKKLTRIVREYIERHES